MCAVFFFFQMSFKLGVRECFLRGPCVSICNYIDHNYDLSSVCTRMWISRNPLWVNLLLHWLHKNNFSPVCMRICFYKIAIAWGFEVTFPTAVLFIANVDLHVPFEIFPTGKPLFQISFKLWMHPWVNFSNRENET